MNVKQFRTTIAAIVLVFIASICFIGVSNDHLECGTETGTRTAADGTTIIIEKHICKEKYNI